MNRELLRESLLWRLLHWLASKLARLPRPLIFHTRRVPAIGDRLADRLTFDSDTEHSLLFRLLQRCNALLCSLGQRLRRQWEASITARVLHCIKQKLSESFLFCGLADHGVTGVLLVLLALYPLWDSVCKFGLDDSGLAAFRNEIMLAAVLAALLIRRLRTARPEKPGVTPAALPILQFVMISLVLLFAVHPYPRIAVAGWYVTVSGILWFFAVTRLLRGREDVLLFCRMAAVLAAVVSLIGVFEFLFAVPIPKTWLEAAETGIRTRAYAIFANPNELGEYLELMLPMTAGLLYCSRSREEKLLLTLCLLLMLAAALFTMSRGAWIAVFTALLVFALLADRRLLPVLMCVLLLTLALPFVFDRLSFLLSDAYLTSAARGGRLISRQTALHYLCQGDMWCGLGLGMYGGKVANEAQSVTSWTYYWVDNYYIRILAESGIIGLISFCVMQLGVLLCGLRAWARVRRTKEGTIAAGILAGLIGILVHSFFECTFDVKFVSALYWIFAALLLWLGFLQKDPPRSKLIKKV